MTNATFSTSATSITSIISNSKVGVQIADYAIALQTFNNEKVQPGLEAWQKISNSVCYLLGCVLRPTAKFLGRAAYATAFALASICYTLFVICRELTVWAIAEYNSPAGVKVRNAVKAAVVTFLVAAPVVAIESYRVTVRRIAILWQGTFEAVVLFCKVQDSDLH